jgi:hypothetical protein
MESHGIQVPTMKRRKREVEEEERGAEHINPSFPSLDRFP